MCDALAATLLAVLDTLAPAERLAFVLHDTFGLPLADVAAIVGRSPGRTRQLVGAARRRVHDVPAASLLTRARRM